VAAQEEHPDAHQEQQWWRDAHPQPVERQEADPLTVARGVAVAKVVDLGQEQGRPASVWHPQVRASKDAVVRRFAESARLRAAPQGLVLPPWNLRSRQRERLVPAPGLWVQQVPVSPRLGEQRAEQQRLRVERRAQE